MPYHHDAYQTGGSNGKFYHYALAKLGASAAHLSPHKNGRALCEAYGAYGWNEGLKTMKWITDHLLVRGINYLVPHAFSPKEYPDIDCPPHFYAHGHNPQYRHMPQFTNYANRLMTLFKGGVHKAPIALFYPAELEWAGETMAVEEIGKVLTTNQIDFDIVSLDHLKQAKVINNKLRIHKETFEYLVIPESEYLPEKVLQEFVDLQQQGVRLIFVNQLPENAESLSGTCTVISLNNLINTVKKVSDLTLTEKNEDLVYYWYCKDGKEYILFFNESISETVDTHVIFSSDCIVSVAYDAYEDTYFKVDNHHLILPPYQTIIWEVGTSWLDRELNDQSNLLYETRKVIDTTWTVSYVDSKKYPKFEFLTELTKIIPINVLDGQEQLAGTVKYQARIVLSNEMVNKIVGIDLGKVYEIANITVNGNNLGTKIAPPYYYSMENVLKSGENQIEIEVTNTLGTQFRDYFSQFLLVEPFGLTEEINWIVSERI